MPQVYMPQVYIIWVKIIRHVLVGRTTKIALFLQ